MSGATGGFDLPLTAGIVIVVGAFVVLLNLAADVAGAMLDPRIRQRSASGLIPLPRTIDARPRARLALNIAVAALVAALLAIAVRTLGPVGHGGTTRAARPRGQARLGRRDADRGDDHNTELARARPRARLSRGEGVDGRDRPRRMARARDARERWQRAGAGRALGATRTPVVYPNQPFSLIVRTDSGGGIKQLIPLPATTFAPDVPATLKPGTTWRGTFSGPDVVKKGTLFYVGFGQFTYDTRFDPRPFSMSSAKSGNA